MANTPSSDPDNRYFPSDENFKLQIVSPWNFKVFTHFLAFKSHTFIVLSDEPVTKYCPLGWKLHHKISCKCPVKDWILFWVFTSVRLMWWSSLTETKKAPSFENAKSLMGNP